MVFLAYWKQALVPKMLQQILVAADSHCANLMYAVSSF